MHQLTPYMRSQKRTYFPQRRESEGERRTD